MRYVCTNSHRRVSPGETTLGYLSGGILRIRAMNTGLLICCAALAVACGKGTTYSTAPSGGPPQGSTSTSIAVGNNFFQPSATTVPAGSTVTWTWAGGVSHNVTFDDGVASSTQSSGTYSRTFQNPGTYAYHCTIHGMAMSGTVTVTAATSGY